MPDKDESDVRRPSIGVGEEYNFECGLTGPSSVGSKRPWITMIWTSR